MPIEIVSEPITLDELRRMAGQEFGDLVKAVVDVMSRSLCLSSILLPGSRIVEARFMGVQQSIAVPKGRDAGFAYLRRDVEDAKVSGLIARAIEKTGACGGQPCVR